MVSTKRAGGASSPMSAVQMGPSVSSPSVSKTGLSSPARSVHHGSSSSSSIVPKYIESERVLCYEPDPTKVKVVYDAKILQVRSQNTVTEYLVHFQGWNASWDRFVPEDFLLKDIPENRALQKQLVAEAEEARLLMSKSKKKKKKSKIRRSSTTPGEDRVNGEANIVPKIEVTSDSGSEFLKNNHQQLQTPQHLHRSSPKKKKKKKKEKGEKVIVPEIFRNSEPKVDKIVIVNGTITSPSHLNRGSVTSSLATSSAASSPKPASPFRTLSSPLPPPLRSASPKFTSKIEATTTPPNNNSAVVTPEQQNSTSANRQRKRKLSAESKKVKTNSGGKKMKSNNPITKYFSSTPVPPITVPTTLTFNKNCSGPKVKEEKSQQQKQNLAVPNNAKKRESLTGYPSINLSDNLKRHLSCDFESVTKKRRLNKIPAEPNIVSVLEDFVRHYAAGRLVAFEKHQRKSMYTAYKRDAGEMTYQRALEAIQMCKEVAEGLRVLIDFNLQRSLLYASAGELEQFNEVMKSGVMARVPPTQTDSNASEHGHQDMEVAIFNGSSPTVSSVDSAASLTCTKTSVRLRKSEILASSHVTDHGDATPVTPSKRRHTTNSSLSRRASCDTTVTANNFHFFCGANAASTRSSTTSNKDGGGSSCSTNSRSTATNRTSLLMPPAASSPSTPAANKVMRSVESWKLVPQSLYLKNPPLPSLVYGPIHLLRLFVKMPEILGRMPLPPKTCKLIVKYMDAVLEYFEGHQDLFAPEVTCE